MWGVNWEGGLIFEHHCPRAEDKVCALCFLTQQYIWSLPPPLYDSLASLQKIHSWYIYWWAIISCRFLFDFYDLVVEKEWLTGLKTKRPKYPSPYCPPTTHSNETIIAGGGEWHLEINYTKENYKAWFQSYFIRVLGKYKLFLFLLSRKPKIITKTKRYYRGQSFYNNIQVRVFILDLCNARKDIPAILLFYK